MMTTEPAKPPPARHPWLHVLGPVGLPFAASVALHVAVGVLLAYSAWTYRAGLAGGHVSTEVVISIPRAAPPVSAPRALANGSPAPAPATVAAPPVLQGLASRVEVAPP